MAAVITREPSNSAALSLLGKTLAQDGETPQAVTHLEAALRVDASNRTALYQMMVLYKKQGRAADAARMSAKLSKLMVQEKAEELDAQRYQLSLEAANQ